MLVQSVGTALSLLSLISQEMAAYHEYAVYANAIEKNTLILAESFERLNILRHYF